MALNWAMVPTAVALLALLILTLMGWPRTPPDSVLTRPGSETVALHPGSQQARQFLGWASSASWRPLTNGSNPFFTLAIQLPPPPAPPAPPPATRKVEVTYRGYFETSARVRRAVIQVADKEMIVGKGEKFLADFAVTAVELGRLRATNAAGAAIELPFGKVHPLEVPAK